MDRRFILDNFKGGHIYAFVGAGGKTTSIKLAARILQEAGYRVLVSTTTKIGVLESKGFKVEITSVLDKDMLKSIPCQEIRFLFSKEIGLKYHGYDKDTFEKLGSIPLDMVILVEGDGSRRMSFKLPYMYEPVIPNNSSRIFLSFDGTILNQEISERNTYNFEAVSQALEGRPLIYSKENLYKLLECGWFEQADALSWQIIITHGDEVENPYPLRSLLKDINDNYGLWGSIVSLKDEAVYWHIGERIGAIILAAGESSRMGEPKQLLSLGSSTFLEEAIRKYSGFVHELVVAVGYHKALIMKRIKALGFKYLEVSGYREGMGASLRESALSLSEIDFFLVTNCDLPLLEDNTIRCLIEAYNKNKDHIIVPRYRGLNGHPVIFPMSLLDLFHEVKGDRGGRDIIRHPKTIFVDVDDPGIIVDIDNKEDYEKIKEAF